MAASVRAVYDTTILASGIVATKDPIALLINAVLSGEVEIILSPYILEELRRTLTNKPYFRDRIPEAKRESYLSQLEAVATVISPDLNISGVVTDPNDDPIIAVAFGAHVPYLVTGDKRVLAVGEYQDVKILSARDFYGILKQQSA